MTTLAEFEKMVKDHDLTYSYSDDGGVFRRGSDSKAAIIRAAKTLPREDVVRIWNAKVDATLAEGYRDSWYWQV